MTLLFNRLTDIEDDLGSGRGGTTSSQAPGLFNPGSLSPSVS